jgi:hypothetical protein
LIVVATVAFCVRALTRQVTSLFSADSSMPRSFTVIASFPFLTGAVRMSVRLVDREWNQYQPPPLVETTRTTATPSASSLRPRLISRTRARREGNRLDNPLGESGGLPF